MLVILLSPQLGWGQATRRLLRWFALAALLALLTGCGGDREEATRTPVPTFTATPLGQAPAVDDAGPAAQAAESPAWTATPVPPTATPTVEPTPTPTQEQTATFTPAPTETPTETPTPTPVPSPTPAPTYSFVLETAEKHPTESLAPNVVRVFLYVYGSNGLGLPGFSVRVLHNGAALPVDQVSTSGLPGLTRGEPSAYTRFTNMNIIFVEAQAGTWNITLIDERGTPVGPPAEFQLTADERTRELYVRFRRK